MGHGLPPAVRIGCAGWALRKEQQPLFPGGGTHLERYARVFPTVEINSSFYRPHRPDTYRRWADAVPPDFRFSAKVPKEVTHTRRLRDFQDPLQRFLSEVTGLGDRLGPLLVQLPPSLAFDPGSATAFLEGFRARWEGLAALEPRHPTWFSGEAEALLRRLRVARAAADPAVVPEAARPGGWEGFFYRRLHGSPKVYYSPYSDQALDALAEDMAAEAERGTTWCVLDNTAVGEAVPNALSLMARLGPGPARPDPSA